MTGDGLIPAQVRGARAMLDWSLAELANAARLSVSTIQRFERGPPTAVSGGVYLSILSAFETAGIRFLDDNGKGYGIQLRDAGSEPVEP